MAQPAGRCAAPEPTAIGELFFKLTKHGSSWVFAPLYNFQGGADGSAPISRVIIGPGSTLYGTTLDGGIDGGCYFWLSTGGCGTVFKLTPPYHVGPNAVGK